MPDPTDPLWRGAPCFPTRRPAAARSPRSRRATGGGRLVGVTRLLVASILIVVLLCGCVSGSGAWPELGDTPPSVAPAGTPPPIIDLHFHPHPDWDTDVLVALFDGVGVAAAGNGANAAPDALALAFAAQHPGRFLPFGGQALFRMTAVEGARAWNLESAAALAYLDELEAGLRDGAYAGIGEILANNARSNLPGAPAVRFPADSPLMRRLWQMSAAFGVPLSVHMEAADASVVEMERLLVSDCRGIWLWAHAGLFAEPPLVRRLLETHANLHLELSLREGLRRWPATLPIAGADGTLRPEWRELLEAFPDRFVIGTDVESVSVAVYAELIGHWRVILAQLSPETAGRIAYSNARRLVEPSGGGPAERGGEAGGCR